MRRVGGETFIASFKTKAMEEFTVEEALVVNVYCQTDSSTTNVVVQRMKGAKRKPVVGRSYQHGRQAAE